MQREDKTRPQLTFVDWEMGVNLRETGWSCRFVRQVDKLYNLKDGEAVIFYNNSRYWFNEGGGNHPPKCRIYWKCNGVVLPIVPAVDSDLGRQVDAQSLLNEWLRKNFRFSEYQAEAETMFGVFETNRQDRLDRMARAAAAAKRRGK